MESWKPIGRAVKYGLLLRRAHRTAHRELPDESTARWPQAAFLIGCGRSGTTIAGEIFKNHPDCQYFFEPYHFWATIDPTIDVLNLYHRGSAKFLLDGGHCIPAARGRFNRLMMQPGRAKGVSLMLEKTPFNAVRIGYLECLADKPKYVHLLRDGVDVARSIDRLSRDRTYQISGKPALNRWWGVAGCKWTALAEEGMAAGYFSDEVPLLYSFEAKGAYEWLVSLAEIDRQRDRLGDRLLEMSYDRFTLEPRAALQEMTEFLGLKANDAWFEKSIGKIDKPRRNQGKPIVLPPKMCAAFNRLQERFGFANRAIPGVSKPDRVQIAMISNEPTPYRVHVLKRLAHELDDVSMHNVFTHTISKPSMPWQMQITPELKPVFFPDHHLTANQPISVRCYPLYHDIRKYLAENDVRLLILLGYNDFTRLALMRWAHARHIPILLAGDSNVFAEGRISMRIRAFKRGYLRWVLGHVSGLMPMGTCGRAFFRIYKDHDLPEFLFPYEPDYSALARPPQAAIAAFRQTNGLATDRKRLLYCGRLIPVKRVDVLLEAFMRIAPVRPDWDLVIAGDGQLRRELESRVPELLRSRIKWLGFLQFDQTVLAYHACDVLVHPSAFEPWGLVINEAVACDLPVITTTVVGAAVELVHHRINGLVIPPRSIDAMANAILEISENGRWLKMRKHCAESLAAWRAAADPVDGVRQALRHFGLLWQSPSDSSETPIDETTEATLAVQPAAVHS